MKDTKRNIIPERVFDYEGLEQGLFMEVVWSCCRPKELVDLSFHSNPDG